MQTRISARHGQISEATREKITVKVEKLTKLNDRLTGIEVTLDLEHSEKPSVEIIVSAVPKHEFVAKETAEELWAAVDACVHKLEQQLRKHKDKVQERNRHPEVKNDEI